MSDGTFDCAPTTLEEKFHQFYVYHGEVHGHTFPLFFVLMEHRKAEDYFEVEDKITKMMRHKGYPIRVTQRGSTYHDMEKAAIQANNANLPGSKTKLCNFHICQMSNKVVTDMGYRLSLIHI